MDENRMALLANVASLYYEDGLNQQAISKQLGYSRSMISRLLTEARQEGIVEIQVHHPLERLLALEERMARFFNLIDVRVLQSNGLAYPQMLRCLGILAARLLAQKMHPETILGISWGTALFEVVNALPHMRYRGVRVVQMIGSTTSRDHQVDGPGLARAFAQRFDGQAHILAAPWLVDDRQLRDALMRDRRMRAVLELACQADIALVGIGTADPAMSSLVRAGYLTEDQANGLQAMGAVGDVCGHHFNIHGELMDVPLAGYPIATEVEVLRKIPLVIGVAGGPVKAPAILGALRAKLVNALVTDDTAAREILEIVGN
jgi:DNA-binding transcriptional regulator LsrR (DeoR family)